MRRERFEERQERQFAGRWARLARLLPRLEYERRALELGNFLRQYAGTKWEWMAKARVWQYLRWLEMLEERTPSAETRETRTSEFVDVRPFVVHKRKDRRV